MSRRLESQVEQRAKLCARIEQWSLYASVDSWNQVLKDQISVCVLHCKFQTQSWDQFGMNISSPSLFSDITDDDEFYFANMID